jgi:hypothetical protein
MSFASADWLSMMLSGLATEPWLTEMVKLGRDAGRPVRSTGVHWSARATA